MKIYSIKNFTRDLIPKQFQVPLKFYYNTIQSNIEPEIKLLKYLVKKNDLVIDVGGNRGIYSYKLWKLGAKIEVFEPNPTCLQVLKPWVANKSNINLHPVGLSNSEGSVNLHIPVDKDGIEHDASASIENANFDQSRDQLISIKTLDSYQFSNVCFIKIDVEGHEYSVLEGAEILLESSKPTLLVEIEQRHNNKPIDDIFQKILSFGYKGFFFNKSELIDISKFQISEFQKSKEYVGSNERYINNFLFIHSDSVSDAKYNDLFSKFRNK